MTISAAVDGREEKMTVKFNSQYVPAPIPAMVNRHGMKPAQIRTDQKPETSYALDIVYEHKNKKTEKQTVHLVMGVGGLGIHVDGNPKIKLFPAIFLGARVPANPQEEAQRFVI